MNEQKMNEMIGRRIEAETPDMLEQLLAEIETGKADLVTDAFQKTAAQKKPRRSIIMRFAAAAAALLLTFSAGWYVGNTAVLHGGNSKATQKLQSGEPGPSGKNMHGQPVGGQASTDAQASDGAQTSNGAQASNGAQTSPGTQAVLASVTLDVNPSVRMEIGNDRRVISCSGLNKEGKDIVNMMDLTGADITVASYAVVGGMLSNGYLTDISNSVLVSVESDQKEDGVAIETALSESLKNYLENSSIGAAIVGQYVHADDSIRQFASDHQISDGKAWIIKNLLSANERLTEGSLLKLSTQELLLLWTSRISGAGSGIEQTVKDTQAGNDGSQPETNSSQPGNNTSQPGKDGTPGSEVRKEEGNTGTTIYGTVSEKIYIGRDRALEAACIHVGIDQAQAETVRTEFDCDDGVIIYEVEFTSDGRRYEVDVRADDGTILENDTEVINAAGSSGAGYDDDLDDDRYETDDDRYDDDRFEADDDLDDDDRYEADDDDRDDDRYDADDDDDRDHDDD